MSIRRIDSQISVAPQIGVEDMRDFVAAGFTTIINNRPDDEEIGQPEGTEIARAATEAGLGYAAIPITHAGFSAAQVEEMAAVLMGSPGPVLAFCRSGTRSCNLWALASVRLGIDTPEIAISKAAAAGYDISGLRPTLDAIAPP